MSYVYMFAACNCNGRSNRCYYDDDLYRRTGHGGHCIQCRDNTAGPNCERCKDNHFRRRPDDVCQPCNCDPTGAHASERHMTSGRVMFNIAAVQS